MKTLLLSNVLDLLQLPKKVAQEVHYSGCDVFKVNSEQFSCISLFFVTTFYHVFAGKLQKHLF